MSSGRESPAPDLVVYSAHESPPPDLVVSSAHESPLPDSLMILCLLLINLPV